jgi:hypothetical protein
MGNKYSTLDLENSKESSYGSSSSSGLSSLRSSEISGSPRTRKESGKESSYGSSSSSGLSSLRSSEISGSPIERIPVKRDRLSEPLFGIKKELKKPTSAPGKLRTEKKDMDHEIGNWIVNTPYLWVPADKPENCKRFYIIDLDVCAVFDNENNIADARRLHSAILHKKLEPGKLFCIFPLGNRPEFNHFLMYIFPLNLTFEKVDNSKWAIGNKYYNLSEHIPDKYLRTEAISFDEVFPEITFPYKFINVRIEGTPITSNKILNPYSFPYKYPKTVNLKNLPPILSSIFTFNGGKNGLQWVKVTGKTEEYITYPTIFAREEIKDIENKVIYQDNKDTFKYYNLLKYYNSTYGDEVTLETLEELEKVHINSMEGKNGWSYAWRGEKKGLHREPADLVVSVIIYETISGNYPLYKLYAISGISKEWFWLPKKSYHLRNLSELYNPKLVGIDLKLEIINKKIELEKLVPKVVEKLPKQYDDTQPKDLFTTQIIEWVYKITNDKTGETVILTHEQYKWFNNEMTKVKNIGLSSDEEYNRLLSVLNDATKFTGQVEQDQKIKYDNRFRSKQIPLLYIVVDNKTGESTRLIQDAAEWFDKEYLYILGKIKSPEQQYKLILDKLEQAKIYKSRDTKYKEINSNLYQLKEYLEKRLLQVKQAINNYVLKQPTLETLKENLTLYNKALAEEYLIGKEIMGGELPTTPAEMREFIYHVAELVYNRLIENDVYQNNIADLMNTEKELEESLTAIKSRLPEIEETVKMIVTGKIQEPEKQGNKYPFIMPVMVRGRPYRAEWKPSERVSKSIRQTELLNRIMDIITNGRRSNKSNDDIYKEVSDLHRGTTENLRIVEEIQTPLDSFKPEKQKLSPKIMTEEYSKLYEQKQTLENRLEDPNLTLEQKEKIKKKLGEIESRLLQLEKSVKKIGIAPEFEKDILEKSQEEKDFENEILEIQLDKLKQLDDYILRQVQQKIDPEEFNQWFVAIANGGKTVDELKEIAEEYGIKVPDNITKRQEFKKLMKPYVKVTKKTTKRGGVAAMIEEEEKPAKEIGILMKRTLREKERKKMEKVKEVEEEEKLIRKLQKQYELKLEKDKKRSLLKTGKIQQSLETLQKLEKELQQKIQVEQNEQKRQNLQRELYKVVKDLEKIQQFKEKEKIAKLEMKKVELERKIQKELDPKEKEKLQTEFNETVQDLERNLLEQWELAKTQRDVKELEQSRLEDVFDEERDEDMDEDMDEEDEED